jgi:hypothetical protein
VRFELDLRNLPRERILGYLVDIGGIRQTPLEALRVTGTNWSAWLEPQPTQYISIIRSERDLLVIEGEHDTAEKVYAFMRLKTMRGGG